MIEVPKSLNEKDRLTWQPYELLDETERWRNKIGWCEFTCSNGHQSTIGRDHHVVAADGTVSPSLVCAHAELEAKCTFHEFVKLIGWNMV